MLHPSKLISLSTRGQTKVNKIFRKLRSEGYYRANGFPEPALITASISIILRLSLHTWFTYCTLTGNGQTKSRFPSKSSLKMSFDRSRCSGSYHSICCCDDNFSFGYFSTFLLAFWFINRLQWVQCCWL